MCYISTGHFAFKADTVYFYSSSKSKQYRIVAGSLNFPGRVLALEDNGDHFQVMFATTKSKYYCQRGEIAIEIESELEEEEEQPQDNAHR
jgi:hypothetical protein